MDDPIPIRRAKSRKSCCGLVCRWAEKAVDPALLIQRGFMRRCLGFGGFLFADEATDFRR